MTQNTTDKKWIRLLSFIVGAIAFAGTYYGVQQVFFKKPSFEQIMVQSAIELNKSCPKMIDQYSRLDSAVVLPGKVLQYHYTLVNLTKAEVNLDTVKKYIEPKIIRNVKISPELKIYRTNQATLNYLYRDKEGEFVLEVSVSPEMYQNQ